MTIIDNKLNKRYQFLYRITSFIAVILFIAGAKLSTQHSVEMDNGWYYCYTVRPGVFSAASIKGFMSVLLGLVCYFLYVLARRRAAEKGVDLELEKPPTKSRN
ncbi:putative modifying wall lignin-1/2 [Helianthus annuus]|nr:putative modifying wall lignin-1/2 [Helianthus annuus]